MSRFSVPTVDATSRYRLRVGNEELAISAGITLIGRDPACRITIFDTLISRRHARIMCDGEHATIEDLGSRNGTRVNGVTISGPHKLRPGDRLGIGSYELIVSLIDDHDALSDGIPTGLLSICTRCRTPSEASREQCPHCGASRVTRELSTRRNEETTRGRWSLGMITEMLGRAMLIENAAEADKLMRQAALLVSDHNASAEEVTRDELLALGAAASWLSKAQGNDAWREWYATLRIPPK